MPGIFLLLPKGLILGWVSSAHPETNKQTNKRFEPSLVLQFISEGHWYLPRSHETPGFLFWWGHRCGPRSPPAHMLQFWQWPPLEQVQPHVWRQDTGFLASWPGWWVAKDGKTHPMWSELGALRGRPCTLGLPGALWRPGHPRSNYHVLI